VPNVEYHGSIGTHTDTAAQIQFCHHPGPGVAAVIRSGMPVALMPRVLPQLSCK